MCHRLLFALAALAIGLVLAAPASAQDPQVDPDSPAGTEYQLPTDRAREEASGSGAAGSDGGSGQAPLFGEGVDKKSTSSAKSGTGSDPVSTTEAEPDLDTTTPEAVRAQAPAPDGGEGSALAIGGGAAGVLLIGGLAGFAWRRRSATG